MVCNSKYKNLAYSAPQHLKIIFRLFKQYWLIAGVNTASKKELKKMDVEYVGKYFGIFCGVFGLFFFFTPFILRYFEITKYHLHFVITEIVLFVVFVFLFGHFKKDRIYKTKNQIEKEK